MSRFHIVTIDPLPNDNHEDHHDDHEDDHRVDHDDVIDTSALTPCLVNNTSSTSSTRSSGSTDRDDSPTRPLIKPSAISPEVENRLNVISGNAITRRFSDNRGCNDLQRNQASIRRIGTWAMDFKSCNIGSNSCDDTFHPLTKLPRAFDPPITNSLTSLSMRGAGARGGGGGASATNSNQAYKTFQVTNYGNIENCLLDTKYKINPGKPQRRQSVSRKRVRKHASKSSVNILDSDSENSSAGSSLSDTNDDIEVNKDDCLDADYESEDVNESSITASDIDDSKSISTSTLSLHSTSNQFIEYRRPSREVLQYRAKIEERSVAGSYKKSTFSIARSSNCIKDLPTQVPTLKRNYTLLNKKYVPHIIPTKLEPLAQRGRLFAKTRNIFRFIKKNGELNLSFKHVGRRRLRYLADFFTTLMDMKWRYDIALFILAFVISWFLFGIVWYIILILHEDHLNIDTPDWKPCVDDVADFTSAMLFSIETQHTIGYGGRAIRTECPHAIILLMVQSVFGVLIQCVMTGIIFAKLSRSKSRGQTILFSKNAVLCKRRGIPCLMFRVGDIRRSQIIGATIHVLLLKRHITEYGEVLPTFQHYLKIHTECDDNFFFLAWPTKVFHKITSDSPLWNVSAESLLSQEMEIVVILEGVVEATGMTTQVRTSYLPGEILWGHRLAPLNAYRSDNGLHTIDYGPFHDTIPTDMPDISPREMVERKQKKSSSQKF